MRSVLPIMASLCLFGCALSGSIKENAISYDDVFEDTTDKLLLVNILRARDKAPLHFADIPTIHESLQIVAGASASLPFGPLDHTAARAALSPSLSIQTTPSFDFNHLDTKDFVTGIASPIDPKFVKYWLDRGVDQNIVLMLFFSSLEIVETKDKDGNSLNPKQVIQIANAPRATANEIIRNENRENKDGKEGYPVQKYCGSNSELGLFFSVKNSLKQFYAIAYPKSAVVAENLPAELTSDAKNFKELASLDPTKLKLKPKKKNGKVVSYDLVSVSSDQNIALCYRKYGPEPSDKMTRQPAQVAGATPTSAAQCENPNADDASTEDEDGISPAGGKAPERRVYLPSDILADPSRGVSVDPYCDIVRRFEQRNGLDDGLQLRLAIRSVGEIIQYLGDLLYLDDFLLAHDDAARKYDLHPRTTIRYCNPEDKDSPQDKELCKMEGEGGYLFTLNNDPARARFTLQYRDQSYSVRDFEARSATDAVDHTLEVLAIIHQLIDLNKSATDVKATPFVQTLP